MAGQTSFQFASINRDRAPFIVASQITTAIAEKRLKPGSRMPTETELMAQFGVGRNALREAVKVLEAYGFLVVRRGEGTYIQENCTFELLAPLFMGLYQLEPDSIHVAEYFSALRHAQMVFNTNRAEPERSLLFTKKLRTLSRILETPEIYDADAIYRYLSELDELRDTLSGQISLARIISFSRLIFSSYFLRVELNDYLPRLLQRVSDVLMMEAIAVSAGPATRFGDYLYHRLSLSQEEIETYHHMVLAPQTRKHFWEAMGTTVSKRIMWEIIEAIFKKEFVSSARFPTEPELVVRYGVSRNVIREATKALEALGLLEIRRPEGTFLCKHPQIPAPFIDLRAYGHILSSQDAESFLNFKIQLRDAVLYLANLKASKKEREEYQKICRKFADIFSTPNVEPTLCYRALDEVNGVLSGLCKNPILQRVNQAVAGIAEESRHLFIDRALERSKQQEVIRSYEEEADLLKENRADDIPSVMLRKVELWKALEITGGV